MFTLRGIITGVGPQDSQPVADGQYTNADGALDDTGTPPGPIETAFPYAVGVPYADSVYDIPFADWGSLPVPDPQLSVPDQGAVAGIGAYDPSYAQTPGAVTQFGHEVSGGPYGDQALGKRMVFIPWIPERYDANGVQTESYADLVAAAVASQGYPTPDESSYMADLLTNI